MSYHVMRRTSLHELQNSKSVLRVPDLTRTLCRAVRAGSRWREQGRASM